MRNSTNAFASLLAGHLLLKFCLNSMNLLYCFVWQKRDFKTCLSCCEVLLLESKIGSCFAGWIHSLWLRFLTFCLGENIFITNDSFFPHHFSFSNLHDAPFRKKNFFKYIYPCKNSTNSTWNFAWKTSSRETNLM